MNFIRQRIDAIKKPFGKGQKWERFAPAVNAFDTFLFVPNHTTQKGAHIRDGVDLKRTMVTVIIALLPAFIYGVYNTGYQYFIQSGLAFTFWDAMLHGALKIMPMVAVSYGVGLAIEFAFAVYRGHEVNEGYLVTGLLVPMIMPVDIPLWMVGLSVAFAVFIAKEAFGGTGMNILNVALTARAFLFFAHPTKMSGNEVWVTGFSKMKADGLVDSSSGATALGDLASFMQDTPALENTQAFQAKYSFMDSFLGFIPGSVGETSALMCLIGAALLLWTGIASWRVIFSFFLGGFLMATILNLVGGNGYFELPAIHQLMIGGFMFGMVFMATDPVTAAHTNAGKFVYGFLGGFLGILIRMVNPAYPEGIMLAILIANVFAPLIDHVVIQVNINKRLKRLKTV